MSRDKKTVIAIICGVMCFSLLSWYPNPEFSDFFRTSLNAILCIFLYLGFNWSRWVVGVFSVIGVIGGVVMIFAIKDSVATILVLSILALFYSYVAFMLLNPNKLKTHFSASDT